MSELQEIEVVIAPGGKVDVRVAGAKGPVCLDLTAEMFQLLGDDVRHTRRTDEYYRQEEQQDQWQTQTQF